MSKINVLHLSDLHISSSEDPSSARLRESLIDDIKKITSTKEMDLDIIVVTGDIVDRGGDDSSYTIAKEFLNKLCKECGINIENTVIVPGNHDIPRRDAIKHLLNNTTIDSFNDEKKYIEYWEGIYPRFKRFNKFVEEITGRWDFKEEDLGGGVVLLKTSIGLVKVFLINSSWSTTGETDYGNLMINRWQLERLKTNTLAKEEAKLSLGLMHHPFDWFTSFEKDIIVDYLTDKRCIPVDVILHGHIHDGKMEYFGNIDRGIFSLVTGIGYPEKDSSALGRLKNGSCRYSIYNFDVEKNILSAWLRVSRSNGDFVADTMLYKSAGENGFIQKHYKSPLLLDEASIALTRPNNVFNISDAEVDSVKRVPEWVGRENELALVTSRKISVLAINGTGGQGKSALASEILRRHSRGNNAKYEAGIWIDCRELPHSLHFKVIETLDSLSGGIENAALYRDEKLEDTIKRFVRYLKKYKLLLVFDNIDAYVKVDTEGATAEFKPILDSILNTEHESLVILTCRPALIHDSGAFQNLKLSGLSAQDGIEFFKKRGVILQKDNEEKYCIKIVELTKGHPYWLGLIAGQIKSDRDSLKKCVEKFTRGEISERSRIQEYFKDIWDQLNKERQKLLRYLVEAHRPLTDNEVSILDRGPDKVRQELRRLERLGLVEPHEGTNESIISYQVHPLIREFIHETFSPAAQEQFVQRVLYIFLPRQLVDILFTKGSNLDEFDSLDPRDLLESLETCLNSRNSFRALNLIEQYSHTLQNGGYHHQYQSLACRILDTVDWESYGILQRGKSSNLISNVLKQMANMGELERCRFYLKKYESKVESNTLSYLNYIGLSANIAWRTGQNSEAIALCNSYENLAVKLDATYALNNVKHIKALSLRESDHVVQALELFEELGSLDDDDESEATYLGNCARCYFKLGMFDKAEESLKKSLQLLSMDSTYSSITNIGYGYLWLAEVMFEQNQFRRSKAFLILAEKVWEEYAPGLLSHIVEKSNLYSNNIEWSEFTLSYENAKKMEYQFLNQ